MTCDQAGTVFLDACPPGFVAKYRRKVFDGDAVQRLRALFGKVCAGFEGHLIEMDGEDDQVHLLVAFQSATAQGTARYSRQVLERRALVAILFRIIVRRRADQHHSPAHRTTANSALRAKARTALPWPEAMRRDPRYPSPTKLGG